MKRKRLVFISGPITPTGEGNHAVEYLGHVRRGTEVAVRLLKAGFAVYCPMVDFPYFLCHDGETLTADEMYEQDMEILRRCDILFALPNVTMSRNVIREKEVAYDEGLVVWAGTLEELEDYGRKRNDTISK